jgi:quinohemoprotein ethanol dehydrogenase
MANEDRRLLLVGAAVIVVLAIPLIGILAGGKGPSLPRDVTDPSPPQSSGVGTGPRQVNQARLAHSTEVDGARIVAADSEPGNWLAHGRTYGEQRFSPLDKINAGNVKDLGVAWSYDTDTVRGLEASPIVVDGVMFTTGSWSVVYALDAKTGEELWKYDPEVPGEWGRKACCDVVNRGVAVWKGRVYFGTLDGRLIALDAKTGKPVWDINTIDRSKPYTITGAPRIVKGRVIIGNGGAELGTRGYVTAYDADTGRQLWRFFVVPGDPRAPVESPEMARAQATWKYEDKQAYKYWEIGGGGTVWDSMAYDPDLDLLYIGTGNGSPWSRFVRSPGGGDNLYLSSIVALKPDTGEMAWYFQTTPGDTWDYTATQHLILADLDINGQPRKVIMQAPKNGYFYVLDRQSGEFISGNNYIPVNWSKGLDAKGRPIEDPAMLFGSSAKVIQPSPHGGHNWQPMSFSPQTKLVYIPVQLTPQIYANAPDQRRDVKLGVWNTGLDFAGIAKIAVAGMAAGAPIPPAEGWIVAWDPIAQKEVWRAKRGTFWNGGTLVTAGNLVFQGSGDGTLKAWSADKGQELWSIDTHIGMIAPPVTYTVDGEQYIAVMAGWGGAIVAFAPEPTSAVQLNGNNNGKLLVFKLGGAKTIEPSKVDKGPMAQPPAETASAEMVQRGEGAFHRYCAVCHGFLAASAGIVPDLKFSTPEVFGRYKEIVLGGELKDRGMASFADQLKPEDVEAIHAYVLRMANMAYRTANNIPEPAPPKPARRGR